MDFSVSEKRLITLLNKDRNFVFEGVKYFAEIVGKPICLKGEPKTDVYVKSLDEVGNVKEFKISFKQLNADFIENKITIRRAQEIFGENWEEIILSSTLEIQDRFKHKDLVYLSDYKRIEKGSITLGWRFEILNKLSGELSGNLRGLSLEQVANIYSGSTLDDSKKNSKVNEKQIKNSGVANYILKSDNIKKTQDIFNNLETIDSYVESNPDLYFACKALNYRLQRDKIEGDRSLSVYVRWKLHNQKLTPELVFNTPLHVKGNSQLDLIRTLLQSLDINEVDDLNQNIFSNSEFIKF